MVVYMDPLGLGFYIRTKAATLVTLVNMFSSEVLTHQNLWSKTFELSEYVYLIRAPKVEKLCFEPLRLRPYLGSPLNPDRTLNISTQKA